MQIEPTVLDLINNKSVRRKIATALGIGEEAVKDAIRKNQKNGVLTKYAALLVISRETALLTKDILTKNKQ